MTNPQARNLVDADADELSDDALDGVAGGLERAWIGDGVPIVSAPENAPAGVEAGL